MIKLPEVKSQEELKQIPFWNLLEKKRQRYNIAMNIDDCLERLRKAETAEEYKKYSDSLKNYEESYEILGKPNELVKTVAQTVFSSALGFVGLVVYSKCSNKMLDEGSSTKITDTVMGKLIPNPKK